MLLILIILAVATAAAIYLARRKTPKALERAIDPAAESYRPLFEPSRAELDAAVLEREREAEAQQTAQQKVAFDERVAEFNKKVVLWSASPTRASTLEIVGLASGMERGTIYIETVRKVVQAWNRGQITGIAAHELAQLLESQFWLLPTGERTFGGNFSLRDEIAGLSRVPSEE